MLRKILQPAPEKSEYGITQLATMGRHLDQFHQLSLLVANMEMQEAAKKGVKPAELLALKQGQLSGIGSQRLDELLTQLQINPMKQD